MSERSFLVIHELDGIKIILKRFIMAEFGNIIVVDTNTIEEAARYLQIRKFDLVLCGGQSAQIPGKVLSKIMLTTSENNETPVIIITSDDSKSEIEKMIELGYQHFIHTPFNAKQLSDRIKEVNDPTKHRAAPRINIPDTKAIIEFEKGGAVGTVVNVSMNGILCEFKYSREIQGVLHKALITLGFPSQYTASQIKRIPCVCFRINVLETRTDHIPARIRIAWQYISLDETQETELQKVIDLYLEEQKGLL
ncbi:response regulator [Deltaproteobacteria bacterium TL4]